MVCSLRISHSRTREPSQENTEHDLAESAWIPNYLSSIHICIHVCVPSSSFHPFHVYRTVDSPRPLASCIAVTLTSAYTQVHKPTGRNSVPQYEEPVPEQVAIYEGSSYASSSSDTSRSPRRKKGKEGKEGVDAKDGAEDASLSEGNSYLSLPPSDPRYLSLGPAADSDGRVLPHNTLARPITSSGSSKPAGTPTAQPYYSTPPSNPDYITVVPVAATNVGAQPYSVPVGHAQPSKATGTPAAGPYYSTPSNLASGKESTMRGAGAPTTEPYYSAPSDLTSDKQHGTLPGTTPAGSEAYYSLPNALVPATLPPKGGASAGRAPVNQPRADTSLPRAPANQPQAILQGTAPSGGGETYYSLPNALVPATLPLKGGAAAVTEPAKQLRVPGSQPQSTPKPPRSPARQARAPANQPQPTAAQPRAPANQSLAKSTATQPKSTANPQPRAPANQPRAPANAPRGNGRGAKVSVETFYDAPDEDDSTGTAPTAAPLSVSSV